MSLGRHQCTSEERKKWITQFLLHLGRDEQQKTKLLQILKDAGVEGVCPDKEILRRFDARAFHPEIVKHCRTLYGQGNFFHSVFEAAKVYNNAVRDKALSDKNGESLMLSVWSRDGGVLKITPCKSETDKNVQDGIKFLSAGLMRAVRNTTVHEPALQWPIKEEDAADILSFASYLFRQVDKAVKHP